MTFSATVGYRYLVYLPPEYRQDSTKSWPLVVFLHGSGERGTNISLVEKWGPPHLVAQGKEFPFILVSPQCPTGQQWDPLLLKKLLDHVEEQYRVDPDRVYVTGLSMGGIGTWQFAERYRKYIAAIAPVCGFGNPLDFSQFKELATLPVWAFHGEADDRVNIKQEEATLDALKAAGDTDVRFTRYPGVGHFSWIPAYNDDDLYTWLLSHKRAPTTQPDD